MESILKKKLKKLKGLKTAIIFGSYAKNKLSSQSDIDLLLVGSHLSLDVTKEIIRLEEQFDREINVIDMTEKEFKQKKNEEFLKNILNQNYIKLI